MLEATNKDFVKIYLNNGLKLIPVCYQSKKPMITNWNSNWNLDNFLRHFDKNPGCNLGILLGDIVDVEGDSAFANDMLESMLGSYPHPKYQSSKSIHHLFVNPDPELTVLKQFSHKKAENRDLEFRAHLHMSVVPPSIHENGARYQWLDSLWPIPEMPDQLKKFYFNLKNKDFNPKEKIETKFGVNHKSSIPIYDQYSCKYFKYNYDVKPGHKKLVCPICRKICFIHKSRFKYEKKAFELFSLDWSCQDCREIDVRPICRKLKK